MQDEKQRVNRLKINLFLAAIIFAINISTGKLILDNLPTREKKIRVVLVVM